MTTIVKGHGARLDDTTTFVPVGTSLKFYSDFDVDLKTSTALIAIADGASATPAETVEGTGKEDDVANYAVYTQDDGFYAKWLAMGGESGLPIKWVGQDIADATRLCSDPVGCSGKTEHTCSGVLGQVKDSMIVILACRGYVADDDSDSNTTYGTDEDPLSDIHKDINKWFDSFFDLLQDPSPSNVAKAEDQVDSLSQGTLALLNTRVRFVRWMQARALKDSAVSGEWDQVIGHLTVNSADAADILQWLVDIPSWGDAFDDAVLSDAQRVNVDFSNSSIPESVWDELRKRKSFQQATDIDDAGDWVPADTDLDEVNDRNQENLKDADNRQTLPLRAGGLLALVGDGHSDDAEAYVRRQQNVERGEVTVVKGGVFSKGDLIVTGIGTNRQLVETALSAVSDKSVRFD